MDACAGDHYNNHIDTVKSTPIYPPTLSTPPPTSTLFLNKISSVFTCSVITIIISYCVNYSRFLPSIFYFFFRALVTIPQTMREKSSVGFCPRRDPIVTAVYRTFQPKFILSSRDKASPKIYIPSEKNVHFLPIRYLR